MAVFVKEEVYCFDGQWGLDIWHSLCVRAQQNYILLLTTTAWQYIIIIIIIFYGVVYYFVFFPSLFCSLSPARKLPSPKKFRNPKTHTLVSNYLASICNIIINVYIFRNVVHISNPVEIVPILLCILLYKNGGKRSLQNDLRACYSHYFVFTEPPFTLYTYRYI